SEIEAIRNKLETKAALTIYKFGPKTICPVLPEAWKKEGIIFTDIGTAIRNDPELFRAYFLEKAILPEDDKFGALNSALFTSGFYLYVPKGIEIIVPF